MFSKDSWTKEIWFYDYRTNIHHTLKKNPDLDNLPDPNVLAKEIAENLESALGVSGGVEEVKTLLSILKNWSNHPWK